MGKGKKQGNVPSCTVKGCKIRMEGANIHHCLKCKKTFCLDHQYPSDHECKISNEPANAKSGSTIQGRPQQQSSSAAPPKPPPQQGLVVISGRNKNKEKEANGTSTPSSSSSSSSSSVSAPQQETYASASSSKSAERVVVDASSSQVISAPHDKLLAQLADSARNQKLGDLDPSQQPSQLLFALDEAISQFSNDQVEANSAGDILPEELGNALQGVIVKSSKRSPGAFDSAKLLLVEVEKYLKDNEQAFFIGRRGGASSSSSSSTSTSSKRNAASQLQLELRWASILLVYAKTSAVVAKGSQGKEALHHLVQQLVEWSKATSSPSIRSVATRLVGDVLRLHRNDKVAPIDDPFYHELASSLWEQMYSLAAAAQGPDQQESVYSFANLLASLFRGVGTASLGGVTRQNEHNAGSSSEGYGILDAALSEMIKANKKSPEGFVSCLALLEGVSMQCKRTAEPHLMRRHVVDKCIQAYSNGSPQVRTLAKRAMMAIIKFVVGPRGVAMTVVGLERALEDPTWRVREGALVVLDDLAQTQASSLFTSLPKLMPLVMKAVVDSRKEVSSAADNALSALSKVVTNPETQKLMPYLLDAIKDPAATDKFLEELMDLTIVNSLDAQSLALIIPVVVRGLREGGTDTKFKASVAIGNVCSIVRRIADLRPFVSDLEPNLTTLCQHSSPQVREASEKAIKTLEDALGSSAWANNGLGSPVKSPIKSLTGNGHSSSTGGGHVSPLHAANVTPFDRSQITYRTKVVLGLASSDMDTIDLGPTAATQQHVEGENDSSENDEIDDHGEKKKSGHVEQEKKNIKSDPKAKDTVDETTLEFITECMSWLLELEISHADVPPPLKQVRHTVSQVVGEILHTAFPKQGSQAVDRLAEMAHFLLLKVFKRAGDNAPHEDIIVDIPNIILAFASKVLLKRAHLRFLRGHRYAVIGQNGVGKTTLVTRIAAKDIEGFPEDISTFYVQHEILSEGKGLSVFDFMLKNCAVANLGKKGTSSKGDGKQHGRDKRNAEAALTEVGFTPEMQQSQVESLSGGWRMRLAIARSMLYEKDILVCDEPTNHLSKAAVDWLAGYLNSLECTVIVVSHDYDFLTAISTDVIHVVDQKLDTFEGTFAEFQEQNPQIVAALPKPSKRIDGAEMGPAASDATKISLEEAASKNPHAAAASASATATAAGDVATEQGSVDTATGAATGAATGEGGDHDGSSTFDILSMAGPEAEKAMAERGILPMKFPDPGKLEGIISRGKPVMKMTDVEYSYPGTDTKVLSGLTCQLSLNSRVCLVGENGAGKSTLLKLLVGELEISEEQGDRGDVWKHHNLRTAYIAQDSMHHLDGNVEQTPVQYLQRRFYEGRDKEAAKMITLSLSEEEKAMTEVRGEICGILSRVKRGKQMYYEVEVQGRNKRQGRDTGRPGDTSKEAKDFRSFAQLQALKKPHVIKLVRMFDEKLKAEASGMDIRPVTTDEILKHLNDFGIASDIAQRKIRWMSGGQRARLVIAAAFWTKPHLVACDEPTNYMDPSTVAVLTHALKTFKGGVVTVSHEAAFVEALCNELWHVKDRKVSVEKTKKGQKKEAMREELGAKNTVEDSVQQ